VVEQGDRMDGRAEHRVGFVQVGAIGEEGVARDDEDIPGAPGSE
jgi:hypothetical protein